MVMTSARQPEKASAYYGLGRALFQITARALPALVCLFLLISPALAQDNPEEELVPSKDRPGYFVNPQGEIVDEFGLLLRLFEHESVCVRCHYEKEKYEKLVLDWDRSKHSKNSVTCDKCHGGNPKGQNVGEAKNVDTTNFRVIKTPLEKLSHDEVPTAAFAYCGQCHGTQFRDWRSGIHGKRTGYWNGEKEYWICIRCHNPHNTKFQKIAPKPAPMAPHMIKFKG